MITELAREDIAQALESSAEVESIYKTIPQKDGSEICLLDRMESQTGGMQQLLNRVVLEQLLTELPDMERRLIIMRYIKMNNTAKNYTALFLGVAALSTSAIFVKLSEAPSPVTAFYRLLFTALALLPFLLDRKSVV